MDGRSFARAGRCARGVVGTIIVVPVVAAALMVDTGSTTTPIGMVGTMIVAFTATVGGRA